MSERVVQVVQRPAVRVTPLDPARLVRRTRLLAWGGIVWHFIEFAIAIAAGVVAGSIALIAFGPDSLIESFAGFMRIAAKTLGESKRGQQCQSIVPSLPMSATVCSSPIRPCSAMGR